MHEYMATYVSFYSMRQIGKAEIQFVSLPNLLDILEFIELFYILEFDTPPNWKFAPILIIAFYTNYQYILLQKVLLLK